MDFWMKLPDGTWVHHYGAAVMSGTPGQVCATRIDYAGAGGTDVTTI